MRKWKNIEKYILMKNYKLNKKLFIIIMNNFLDTSNKALLWTLLYEQEIFENIPNNNVGEIRSIFDKELEDISNKSSQDDLMGLNKIAIYQLKNKIDTYKVSILEKSKEKNLTMSLNKKQEEFDNLINFQKPKEPQFSDQKDEPFDSKNMEYLMNQMKAMRETELHHVLETNTGETPKKLNIGNSIQDSKVENQIINIKNDKKVSFQDTDPLFIGDEVNEVNEVNENNFLKNLKKIDQKTILDVEYKSEKNFNENLKFSALQDILNTILLKVENIEDKLEKLENHS